MRAQGTQGSFVHLTCTYVQEGAGEPGHSGVQAELEEAEECPDKAHEEYSSMLRSELVYELMGRDAEVRAVLEREAKLKGELRVAQDTLANDETLLTNQAKELLDSRKQVKQLQTQMSEAVRLGADAVGKLGQELTGVRQELSKVREEHKTKTSLVSKLTRENQSLKERSKTDKALIGDDAVLIGNQKEIIRERTREVSESKAVIEQLHKEVAALQTQLQEETARAASMSEKARSTDRDGGHARIQELEGLLHNSQRDLGSLEGRMEMLEAGTEEKVALLERKHPAKLKELQHLLDTTTAEVEGLRQDNARWKEQSEEQERARRVDQARLRKLEDRYEEDRKTTASLTQTKERLLRKIRDLESQLDRLAPRREAAMDDAVSRAEKGWAAGMEKQTGRLKDAADGFSDLRRTLEDLHSLLKTSTRTHVRGSSGGHSGDRDEHGKARSGGGSASGAAQEGARLERCLLNLSNEVARVRRYVSESEALVKKLKEAAQQRERAKDGKEPQLKQGTPPAVPPTPESASKHEPMDVQLVRDDHRGFAYMS